MVNEFVDSTTIWCVLYLPSWQSKRPSLEFLPGVCGVNCDTNVSCAWSKTRKIDLKLKAKSEPGHIQTFSGTTVARFLQYRKHTISGHWQGDLK